MNIKDYTFNPIAGRMLTTTLADIRKLPRCQGSWKELLKGLGVSRANKDPLPLERILEINGFDDALEALRAVQGHDGAIRLFACYCARYVLDVFEREFPEDKRPREAIETAERFARGEATNEELDAAFYAAGAAARAGWDAYTFGNIIDFPEFGDAAETAAVAALEGRAAYCVALVARLAASASCAWNAENRRKRKKATRDDFKREFLRMCRLEGEYGEVSQLEAQKLV
jgi:hypothetical protein